MARQKSYELMDLFLLEYKQKYKKPLTINRYKEKWGFQDMIDSLGWERAVEVVRYFFKTTNPHTPTVLFNIFDRLDKALLLRDKDREDRAKIRQQTKERVENWERENESGSQGN